MITFKVKNTKPCKQQDVKYYDTVLYELICYANCKLIASVLLYFQISVVKMSPKKTHDKDKNSLKCKHCNYSTHRKAFMDDHMRSHTGDRPFR